MKEFYIIRHGETDFNKKGIIQGRGVDSDLNEIGQTQAAAFYRAYKHIIFDKIYTSTLKRTHQTVDHFIKIGTPWEQLSGLDELDWGENEGREVTQAMKDDFYKIIKSWMGGELHVKFTNGESPLEVRERQLEALNHMLAQAEEKKVLICMHGRAMRVFLCLLLNVELHQMDSFPHTNLTLYRLFYDGEQFEVLDFNNTDHFNA